jgi:hypothetical protein
MVSTTRKRGREGVGGDHSFSLKGGSRSIPRVMRLGCCLGDDGGRWTVCTLSTRSGGTMYIVKTTPFSDKGKTLASAIGL